MKKSKTNNPRPHTRRVRKTKLAVAVAGTIMAINFAAAVQAQELEEVIVTATKRAESVQDVPVAITALSGDFTRTVNMDDVKDLIAFTPGVTGNSQDSFIDAVSVRGIRTQDFGVGGDPSAAFFKNDLYEGRNGSAVTSLYDMERSEILRGPQGFLFGRNSIGGAFSVHTNKADIDGGNSGYIDLDVAEYGRFIVEGALNLPVTDKFALRIAGYSSQQDGAIKNFADGNKYTEHDKQALRLSGTFEDGPLSITGMVEYETREQSGSIYRAIQEGETWDNLTTNISELGPLRGSQYEIDSDMGQGDADDADILTFGLRIDYDFDFATLTSNTGYKDHDYFYTEDYDGTPLYLTNYGQDQEGTYFQQELRLTSNSEGPLSWYAGASYYEEEIDTLFQLNASEDHMCQYYGNAYYPGNGFTGCADLYAYYGSSFTPTVNGLLEESGRVKGKYTGWSTYADLNYAITEKLELGVGARYTYDKKRFTTNVPTPTSDLGPYWAYGFSTDGDITSTEDWSDTQLRVVARYRPTDERMFYASYTEGYKSGGFGSFSLSDANGNGVIGVIDASAADGYQGNTFDPEQVDSYEIGYKDTIFGDTSDINLTAFYYDYTDLQVLVADGGAAAVKNIGTAKSSGVEAAITSALGENFSLYVAFSYLDSETTDVQQACTLPDSNACEGRSLFWAPEYSGAIVLSSHHEIGRGELLGSLELTGESKKGGGWEDLNETVIDSFYVANARLKYQSDNHWGVGVYVENLLDEEGWDGSNNNGGISPAHFVGPMRPRTFGVNLSYDWD